MATESVRSAWLDNRRTAATILAVIVLVGLGIRAYRLTDRSIWFDEASSWRTVQLPVPEMLDSVGRNDHLPLHYLLLKLWIGIFGDSLWAMRGLSVLLSGVAMIGVYLFAKDAFRTERTDGGDSPRENGRWIGLLSAALIAVSVIQVRAAWEARMYTLGTALVALSSWTLFRALRVPEPSWRRWIVHAFVTLLLAYTHIYALFSIAAQVVFLAGYFLLRWRRNLRGIFTDPTLRRAIISYAFIAICWAPSPPELLRQTSRVQGQWWAGRLGAWGVVDRAYEMFFDVSPNHFASVMAAFVCVGVLVPMVWKAGAASWYVACLAALPFGMGAGASIVLDKNVFILRYLVFAQMFLIVGLAALMARIRDPWVRNILAVFVVANGAAIYADYWVKLDVANKPGMKAAIAFVQADGRSDEQVIVSSPLLYFPASYYFNDRARCHLYSNGKPFVHYRGGPIITIGDLIVGDQIRKLAPGRVWVISGGWELVQVPIPRSWRPEDQEQFREVFEFQGSVDVAAYTIPSSPAR